MDNWPDTLKQRAHLASVIGPGQWAPLSILRSAAVPAAADSDAKRLTDHPIVHGRLHSLRLGQARSDKITHHPTQSSGLVCYSVRCLSRSSQAEADPQRKFFG